jgi:hypothetical protein
MAPSYIYRLLGIVVCLSISMSATVDTGVGLSTGATVWPLEEQLPNQPPFATAEGLIGELRTFVTNDAGKLDAFWLRLDQATFAMGCLLSEAELTAVLETLRGAGPGSTSDLVLALFWSEYGDERVPRRLAESEHAYRETSLADLSMSAPDLVRAAALVAICRGRIAPQIDPGEIAALNDLAAIAPEQEIAASTALDVLARHLAGQWRSGNIESNLDGFAAAHGCSDEVMTLLANTAVVREVLPQLEGVDSADVLLEAVRQNPDSVTRRWCAVLLARLGIAESALPDDTDPQCAVPFLAAALDSGEPRAAYECLVRTQTLHRLSGRDAPLLNALGMALVRDGAEDEAIEVFSALADANPGSQLAANAEEHIEHLKSVRKSRVSRGLDAAPGAKRGAR